MESSDVCRAMRTDQAGSRGTTRRGRGVLDERHGVVAGMGGVGRDGTVEQIRVHRERPEMIDCERESMRRLVPAAHLFVPSASRASGVFDVRVLDGGSDRHGKRTVPLAPFLFTT